MRSSRKFNKPGKPQRKETYECHLCSSRSRKRNVAPSLCTCRRVQFRKTSAGRCDRHVFSHPWPVGHWHLSGRQSERHTGCATRRSHRDCLSASRHHFPWILFLCRTRILDSFERQCHIEEGAEERECFSNILKVDSTTRRRPYSRRGTGRSSSWLTAKPTPTLALTGHERRRELPPKQEIDST